MIIHFFIDNLLVLLQVAVVEVIVAALGAKMVTLLKLMGDLTQGTLLNAETWWFIIRLLIQVYYILLFFINSENLG